MACERALDLRMGLTQSILFRLESYSKNTEAANLITRASLHFLREGAYFKREALRRKDV